MPFQETLRRIMNSIAIVIDEMGDLTVVLAVIGIIAVSALFYFAF